MQNEEENKGLGLQIGTIGLDGEVQLLEGNIEDVHNILARLFGESALKLSPEQKLAHTRASDPKDLVEELIGDTIQDVMKMIQNKDTDEAWRLSLERNTCLLTTALIVFFLADPANEFRQRFIQEVCPDGQPYDEVRIVEILIDVMHKCGFCITGNATNNQPVASDLGLFSALRVIAAADKINLVAKEEPDEAQEQAS